ncbi:MAG: hypothetical protein Q8Q05_01690 [bacterium]|nr:hypothetical protein [bacterium]MDZ4343269.1 hypothetical protein [Candidatus Binatia bacterium]
MAGTIYRCKTKTLPGTQYAELNRAARKIFHEIEKKTKRQPYIRSPYFDKDKIFIKSFWDHLVTKGMRDKARRVKFYSCALELIKENKSSKPEKIFESKREEIYRFAGISADERKFSIQIRHDLKTGHKYFTSVFPE